MTDTFDENFYREVWDAGMRATLARGAALSHHHGVGLNRARFVRAALGDAFDVLAATITGTAQSFTFENGQSLVVGAVGGLSGPALRTSFDTTHNDNSPWQPARR